MYQKKCVHIPIDTYIYIYSHVLVGKLKRTASETKDAEGVRKKSATELAELETTCSKQERIVDELMRQLRALQMEGGALENKVRWGSRYIYASLSDFTCHEPIVLYIVPNRLFLVL